MPTPSDHYAITLTLLIANKNVIKSQSITDFYCITESLLFFRHSLKDILILHSEK